MPSVNIHNIYIKMAKTYSYMSYAKRKKVGALLVRDGRIVSTGYNGMPKGMNNSCEFIEPARIYATQNTELITKPDVIHAEMNAILFAARNGQSTDGCSLYVTLSPCSECAKHIIQSGIKEVYYSEEYRKTEGLQLLRSNGISCIQVM